MNKILIPAYYAITAGCNLSCKYCYVPKEIKKQDGLFLDSFKELTNKINTSRYLFSFLTFHGVEPTILKGETFKEMIQYYRDVTGHMLKFRLQTNGQNLNGLDEAVSPDDLSVGISMDCFRSNHDSMRGKGSWDKALNSVMTLRRKGFNVGVMSVLNSSLLESDNLRQFKEFADFLTENKIDLQIKPVSVNRDTISSSISNEQGYELGRKLVEYDLQKYTQFLNLFICSTKGNHCQWFQFNVDGSTYACNKYFLPNESFANWKEMPMEEVVFKRSQILTNEPVNSECFTCKYWHICKAGCPSDRVDGKSVDCWLKKGALDLMTKTKDLNEILFLKGFHDG